MIKKNGIYALISAVIMLCLPFLTVTFFNNENGLAVVIILFFIVNPIAALSIGVCAGKYIKAAWFQPLLLSVLFIVGTRIFFELVNTEILIYAGCYLIIGVIAMQLSALIRKKRR